MELHFDFTRAATRAEIATQLKAALSDEAWAEIEQSAQAAGVPEMHHHSIVDVRETIASLDVNDRVRSDMAGVYEILAAAEAQVHGCSVEQTHFHEVGNARGIRGALVLCLAIDALNPSRITATHVQTGFGTVRCSHGEMDIPAPATAAILRQGIPTCDEKLEGELCTPTSAAIIKHFVNEFTSIPKGL